MTFETAELAYAAGLVDGEGCVGAYSLKHNQHQIVQVTIANTNEAMIAWLNARWPGSVQYNAKHRTGWKPVWRWTLSSRKAEMFLRNILPFLIVKRPQAELCLTLRGLTKQNWSGKPQCGGQTVSSDVLEQRRQIVGQLRKANHRGL